VIRRRTFGLLAATTVMASMFSQASAQDWPTRKLTMVYPFGAGSAGDVIGRLFASRLAELLGQPVVFENVGGAGGMTGTVRVAKAAPDGYQVLMTGINALVFGEALHRHAPYNAATDFAPVVLVADQPSVLVVRSDFPANNLREFIAYAKANQAKMQYGSAGVGSSVHMACALLNVEIGVNTTHVPYRSGAAAMQDLIAGRIDYQCPLTPIALPQIEGKAVRPIALLAKDRIPVLPDLATAHEQGLVDFDVQAGAALWLPRGTPAAIVRKLHDAAVAAMETPSVQARLREIGATVATPERRSPEYLQELLASEIMRWPRVIKAANIVVD